MHLSRLMGNYPFFSFSLCVWARACVYAHAAQHLCWKSGDDFVLIHQITLHYIQLEEAFI